jgi:hypothetical protein
MRAFGYCDKIGFLALQWLSDLSAVLHVCVIMANALVRQLKNCCKDERIGICIKQSHLPWLDSRVHRWFKAEESRLTGGDIESWLYFCSSSARPAVHRAIKQGRLEAERGEIIKLVRTKTKGWKISQNSLQAYRVSLLHQWVGKKIA